MRIAARPVRLAQVKRSKYRATPTVVDGVRFASKREAKRYGELRMLEWAGELSELVCQPRFALTADGQVLGHYVADFQYVTSQGALVVEDVKSTPTKTALYRWKKKHMEAQYGIRIKEVP